MISTLGGMEIYGINGFVIGPLIAALFLACWNLLSGRDHEGNVEEINKDFMEEGKILQIYNGMTITKGDHGVAFYCHAKSYVFYNFNHAHSLLVAKGINRCE